MMMVKAGPAGRRPDRAADAAAVDKGDILIDGGNTLLRRHRAAHEVRREQRACSSSAPASPAAKRARCKGPSMMPGGSARRLAARQADLPGDRRQGRPEERHPLLRVGRPARRRALREDGAQRHRVRRHAAHLRGLLPAEGSARPVERRAVRRVRRVEPRRARQLPDRDHPRHLQRQGPEAATATWSTRSSTRPAPRGPASG